MNKEKIYYRESRYLYLIILAGIIFGIVINDRFFTALITIGLLLVGIIHNEQRPKKELK